MHPYLTPWKIEQLARDINMGFDHHTMSVSAAVKAVLEREANPKPIVFRVTLPSDTTLGPEEIRDCLLGTAHIATEKERIVVEEFWQ